MGGNLFEGNRRLHSTEFKPYAQEVLRALYAHSPRRMSIIPYVHHKESFGDLDVVIEKPAFENETIARLFDTNNIVRNGNIISFQYQDFQTDLIFVKPHDYEISLHYFSWNDCGNLLGRIFHKMGFKYGMNGLHYVLRKGDWKFDEVCVTKRIEEILPLLDLSSDEYVRGFDTIEDMYRFVSKSPYFNKHIYLLDNRSHDSRTRDRKRKVYHDFLLWMEQQPNLPEYPWPSFEERGGYQHKEEWFQKICQAFPDFYARYQVVKEKFDRQIICKEKFNGKLVMEWTGLTGPQLGDMMIKLKGEQQDIFNMSQDEIYQWVMSHVTPTYEE